MKSEVPATVASANSDAALVESRIRQEVAELSGSLSALFATLPGPARRAADLVKTLNIDNPLACRLLRVARAADPAEAVEYLPTVNQIRGAVDAAGQLAPGPVAEAARQAVESFGRLVGEFGNDQRGFESLVASLSPKGVRRVDLQHRRAAFRANQHMWGLSAECVISLMVMVPGARPGYLDFHAVQGFVNARIMRPNMKVKLRARMRTPGEEAGDVSAETVGTIGDAHLLTDFSTIDPTALREERFSEGFRGTRVEFRGVRPTHAETFFVQRFVPEFVRTDSAEFAISNSLVSWPAEMVHRELVIPVGHSDPSTVVLESFARREDPKGVYDLDPDDQVPLHDAPTVIRGVTSPPPTPEVPRLPELFASIAGRHVAAGTRFDIYRARVAFPMLHSLISLRVKHVPVTGGAATP